ncbi:MAG: SdiA-regulated domain-containing protein [Pseudomonadota bacterium]
MYVAKRKSLWLLAFVIVATLIVYLFKLEALGWYYWHAYKHQATGDSLHLKDYQVEIDGLRIPELADASGFTHNTKRNTLFTVLNRQSQIVELDLTGKVIRKVHVTGVDDMEGITHIAENRYVIADERDSRLILVILNDDSTELDVTQAPKLRLGMNSAGNKNFEGVSWDDNNRRLLVVKERDPKYIMSVTGFFDADIGEPLDVEIKKVKGFERAIKWSLRDLSSVTYHSETGHLLLLSDESRLIKEYDEDGKALGALALWKGFHGLQQNVPQAEGIAIGSDGSIYIMSEPNLFYKFKPG